MKMSKRIFVCLIVLAISVSLFAFGSFADDSSEPKYTVDNHGTILEYYEEPIIFDLDFEGEELVTDGYVNDSFLQIGYKGADLNKASVAEDSDGNKYLDITCGTKGTESVYAYLNWNAEEGKSIDDFLMNFSVKMSGTNKTNQKVSLYLADAPVADDEVIATSPVGTSLISFNFNTGVVVYYDSSDSGVSANLGITADTFYNVSIDYSVANGTYSLVISTASDGTVLLSVSDLPIPYESVGNVRIGAGYLNLRANSLCFDNVSASGGSFIRYEADKIPETERAIADFLAICESEDAALEDKVEVLKTAFKLIVNHGVTGSDDAAAANILAIQKTGVGIFVDEISSRLALLTDELPYDERVELVNECTVFADLIPEDISYMGDEVEAINGVIATYAQELALLDTLKTDSEAVLAALADIEFTNTNSKIYGYVKPYYEAVVDHTPYLGYPGISEIYETYLAVIEKFEELTEKGETFISNVETAANTDNSFGVRFAAYVLARDDYFDDASFPNIDAALASYDAVNAEMVIAIDVCEHFLLNVSRADYSQYLSAKKSALDAASRGDYAEGEDAPAIDTQLNIIKESYAEYPGMSDALALYDSLVSQVTADEQAANAYVSAVLGLNEIKDTLTKAELEAKIAEAEQLQLAGNVIGVDGVTEANIILNNLKTQFELSEGYKKQFSSVVGQLAASSTASEIFDLAHEAYSVVANAEKYEGVSSSDVDTLSAKVNAYNETVKALNAGFKAANDVACNTVSASSGSPSDDTPVGLIATIIKKFYE